MYKTLFPDFDDQAKIWIYGIYRQITDQDKMTIKKYLDEFVATWKSHGDEVTGDYTLLFDRFIIIAAKTSDVSGCSIDSSVRVFKDLKNKHGINALDLNLVFFRSGNHIKCVKRFEFASLNQSDNITPETLVFDTSIQSLYQLRQGKFEVQVGDSWHANLSKKVA